MRFSRKYLYAAAAPLALAGGIVTAAAASAAPAAPAAAVAYHAPQPSVRGDTKLVLTYNGSQYTYKLRLAEFPVNRSEQLIEGQLGDPYEPGASAAHPVWLALHGIQVGNEAVLTVQYPATGRYAGPQGDRTFTFVLSGQRGAGAGVWNETGSEAGAGLATIGR